MSISPEHRPSGQNPQKTRLDCMFFALQESAGSAAVEAFKNEVLPSLRLSSFARQTISEEEYQRGIEQIRRELPYFLKWLLDQKSLDGFDQSLSNNAFGKEPRI